MVFPWDWQRIKTNNGLYALKSTNEWQSDVTSNCIQTVAIVCKGVFLNGNHKPYNRNGGHLYTEDLAAEIHVEVCFLYVFTLPEIVT